MPAAGANETGAKVVRMINGDQLRAPPHSIEAEHAVIGGLLLDNDSWGDVSEIIEEADFYRHDHRLLFQAIRRQLDDGKPADVVTVAEFLDAQGELENVGGMAYLGALASNTPSTANIRSYAAAVRERSKLRQLIRISRDIADYAFNPGDQTHDALLDNAREMLDGLADRTADEQRFQLVRAGELQTAAPAWLVRHLLEENTLALVFGDPGHGKSFFAVDISCSISTGTKWHGRTASSGPVIYVAGEGHNGLSRRIKAWSIRNGIDIKNAPLFVSTAPIAMLDKASANTLKKAVDEIAKESCAPALVVVDTVARNFGPGDENSTSDMVVFIAAADEIRTRYGCTVLLVHHSGHGDKTRARGAMALKGALDAEYRVTKDGDMVRLEATKMKDSDPPPPMAFKLRTVELGFNDDEGQPVTSATLDEVEWQPAASTSITTKGIGGNQRIALDALRRLYEHYRSNLAGKDYDPAGARVSITDWREAMRAEGIDRRRITDAVSGLASRGLIRQEGVYIHLTDQEAA
jgi:KaiC/GvpD/RAD55 family RecA-like ATPase